MGFLIKSVLIIAISMSFSALAEEKEEYNPLKKAVGSQAIFEALLANNLPEAYRLLSKEDALILIDFRELRDKFLTQTLNELRKQKSALPFAKASRQELCQAGLSQSIDPLIQKYEGPILLGKRAGGLAEHEALMKFKNNWKDPGNGRTAMDDFYAKRRWVVPKLIDALEELGHLLSFSDRKSDAQQAYLDTINIAPDRLSVYQKLAELKVQCYFGMKDYLLDKEEVKTVFAKICDLSPTETQAKEIYSLYPDLCQGAWSKPKISQFAKSYKYQACTDMQCPANRCFELSPELFWYCSLAKDYDKGIAQFAEELKSCGDALQVFATYATPSVGGRAILDSTLNNCKNNPTVPAKVRKAAGRYEQKCLDKLPLEEKQGFLGEFTAAKCGLHAFQVYYEKK